VQIAFIVNRAGDEFQAHGVDFAGRFFDPAFDLIHRIVRPTPVHQPPPEKCDVNARANDPKPPRVTPPEVESDEVPGAERLDEESLLDKPLRDGDPPELPRPLDEDPRGAHSALV
jgi:hypothetical protein